MKYGLLFKIVFFAGLSFFAALFGLGLADSEKFTPTKNAGVFNKIFSDGWIEHGGSIGLSGLATRGNQLKLSLNPWRPDSFGKAHLRASVCGEIAADFVVATEAEQTIFLTGACNPRLITFEVVNPFVASENGQRLLGAQLKYARVTSKLGFPLVNLEKLLQVAAGIFVVTLLFSLVFSGSLWEKFFWFLPAVAAYFLATTHVSDFSRIESLWLFTLTAVAGAFFASKMLAEKYQDAKTHETYTPSAERTFYYFALVLVVLGGVLRFHGIKFGLPANYHPDEVPKVNAIMRMVTNGNFDPQYFLHPSFLLYSSYFVNKVFHFLGMTGEFRDTAFLAGRTVSAVAGTLSIFMTFAIGRRLYSAPAGLLAAAILAFLPLHVTCSRYMKEDALLLSLILAAALLTLKSVQQSKKYLLLLAGLFAGLSASTKYSGLLSGFILCGAPWLRSKTFKPDWQFLYWTIAGLALVPVGFLIFTPYCLITPEKFLKDFRSEQHHMQRGHTIAIDAWSEYWMFHFSRSIIPGMSWFTALAATFGLGVLAWRRKIEDLYLLALILLFYMPAEWVKAKPAPQPERYIVPCLPFLALAATRAIGMIRGVGSRVIAPVLAFCCIFFPAQRSLQLASEVPIDTRDQLAQWMIENIPRGSKLYVDWKPYCPRFFNNEFEVNYVPRPTIMKMLEGKNLKNSGQDYLILSSLFYDRYFTQPQADAGVRQRLRNVFENVPIVKEFAPKYGTYGFHNPTVTLFSLKAEDFARLEAQQQEQKTGVLRLTDNQGQTNFKWFLKKG